MNTAKVNPQDVSLYRAAAREALAPRSLEWREVAWAMCLELEARIGRNRARAIESAIRRQLNHEGAAKP
jgi:hypothetical protein